MSKYNAQKSKELRSQRSLLLFESGIKSDATLKAYTYQLENFLMNITVMVGSFYVRSFW